MESIPSAESGFGFLARLGSKSKVLNLNTTLFPNGLLPKEIVELCGKTSSGKTLLLTQLIAKCLLPSIIEGLGVNVLFINTDCHFSASELFNVMIKTLKNNSSNYHDQAEVIVRESMKNLSIVNCYDFSQFITFLHSLDVVLLDNESINLIVIDSISAFYWANKDTRGHYILDQHIKSILQVIKKHLLEVKVPLIYTKSCDTVSSNKEGANCTCNSNVENIHYRIHLYHDDKKRYCTVESSSEQEKIQFTITNNVFNWS